MLGNSVFATGLQTSPSENHLKPSPQSSLRTAPLKGMPNVQSMSNATVGDTKILPVHQQALNTQVPAEKAFQKQSSAFKIGTVEEAQKYLKISLSDAIDYAMAHNSDIIQARLDVNIAKNNIKVANQLKNPYVQYFFNGGTAATDNPNNFGLIVPVEILKRSARKNLAKSNFELTKRNVLLNELMLRLDVRQYYTDLVSFKSTLKVLNDQKQLLLELVNIAQKKYEAGASPQMDVIQAKMMLNQLLIQVNSAKTDVLVSRHKFNFLLQAKNFDTKEDYLPEQNEFVSMLTPIPSGKMPDFETLFDIALQKRLDIKVAQQDLDVANKNLTIVIRQRIPDVEVGGGPIFVPQQWSSTNKNSYGAYVGGNITNIPLLYFYNPEVKNAKIQIEQKRIAYDAVKHQALMDLHSAYDTFITAQTNLNYYNDILLSESKQFLNMAKRSYEVGKTSITDYIFIEQSYKNIMVGYIDALSNYYDAWVGVLREVNDEDLKLNG